jgi:predicted membrane channel-forming protein YqfA (hemolysin III family)
MVSLTEEPIRNTYPTGEIKPKYRGYIHRLSFYIIPIIYACLQFPHCTTALSTIVATINASAPMALYYTSSYFHIDTKNLLEHELWQRLDYTAIYYYIFASNIGFIMLLWANPIYRTLGILMMALNVSGFIIGVIRNRTKELSNNKDKIHQLLAGSLVSLVGLAIYPIFKTLGINVILTIILIWINNAIGLLLYNNPKVFNFIEDIFGHHEWFHVTTVVGEVISWIYKFAICNHLNLL